MCERHGSILKKNSYVREPWVFHAPIFKRTNGTRTKFTISKFTISPPWVSPVYHHIVARGRHRLARGRVHRDAVGEHRAPGRARQAADQPARRPADGDAHGRRLGPPRGISHAGRTTKIVQGWPKLRANLRALILIFSQSVGPRLAIWADPAHFSLPYAGRTRRRR